MEPTASHTVGLQRDEAWETPATRAIQICSTFVIFCNLIVQHLHDAPAGEGAVRTLVAHREEAVHV
jgi:hypothetical protein